VCAPSLRAAHSRGRELSSRSPRRQPEKRTHSHVPQSRPLHSSVVDVTVVIPDRPAMFTYSHRRALFEILGPSQQEVLVDIATAWDGRFGTVGALRVEATPDQRDQAVVQFVRLIAAGWTTPRGT